MKTCFLTNEFPPHIYGGAGVHVDYLSKELTKLLDIEVRDFSNTCGSGSHGVEVRGAQVDENWVDGFPKEMHSIFSTIYRNFEFIKYGFKPDIVHCHTWYTHLAGFLAKKAYGIPFVLTTHSLEPLRPWKREQLGRGYDVSSWIEKQAIENADAVIAVSKATKDDVLNHFNIDQKNIEVIPNGIDTNEYCLREKNSKTDSVLEKYGIDPHRPYVLFVGRITRQKGIIHLVNAIDHIDAELQIVLCAGAPDTPEIKEEMESLIAKKKEVRSNIVWVQEMVKKPDVIDIYGRAHLFCCPSVYEPFGIINLEAMSCGTPVVGSRVGGIPEVVVDQETGILVDAAMRDSQNALLEDAQEFSRNLALAINKIFRDEELTKKMSEASRKRVVEKFSWAAIAAQVFDVYTKVIEKNRKGNPS